MKKKADFNSQNAPPENPKRRLEKLKQAPQKLSLGAKAVIGALASSYTTFAIFITKMMSHSGWIIWASLVSFLVTMWTLWVEFRPKTRLDLISTRPFIGERFIGGLFTAMNVFILCRVIWYFQGSAPYELDSKVWFYTLLAGMLALFPISIWASGILVRKDK